MWRSAEPMISMGEISAARQVLEGSPFAPGNQDTLDRPPVLRDPIPEDLLRSVPARPFELDKEEFLHSLRTACRGAAGGPSGMRTEQLRPLLDNEEDSNNSSKWLSLLPNLTSPKKFLQCCKWGR